MLIIHPNHSIQRVKKNVCTSLPAQLGHQTWLSMPLTPHFYLLKFEPSFKDILKFILINNLPSPPPPWKGIDLDQDG